MIPIPASHWHDNGDGTAWWLPSWPFTAEVCQQLDRPCDNHECPHVREPLPVVTLHHPCAETEAGREIEGGYRRLGDGRLAHRVAWESHHGPIPDGMVVMHLCDNPPCCEPTHLKLGTRAENNADRDRKGRNRRPNQRGEAHSNAKLTDADVDAILASDEPATVLGPRYGVNPDHIRRIRRGDRRTKKAVCPDWPAVRSWRLGRNPHPSCLGHRGRGAADRGQ
jgi:HNH endonuclease